MARALQLVVCEYASLELVQSHTHPALHTITAYLLKLWSDHSQVRDEDFYPDPKSLLKIETRANGSEIDALVEADS